MSNVVSHLGDDPLKVLEYTYGQGRDAQANRNTAYKQHYNDYCGYMDITKRDPDRANIFIPKIFSIVEGKVPRDIKAIFGIRPYIPVRSNRPDYMEIAKWQAQYLDDLLYKGGAYQKFILNGKLKTLYGTGFSECIPHFQTVTQRRLQMTPMGPQPIELPSMRLRFDQRVYAPWEMFVDPYATNLEEPGGCRWIVIFQLASRAEIVRMAEKGAYPNLDVELLMSAKGGQTDKRNDHWGLQMLADQGLIDAGDDEDMGVLMRFQSPDRYIDCWNGTVILRDGPNPYKHGLINVSKLMHTQEPHTQNQFWGLGEAQPAKILQAMLNGLWNMTFDSHAQIAQPVIYYKQDAVHPDSLVRIPGNRVAVATDSDRPIANDVLESPGQALPPSHYILPQTVEDMLDLESGYYEVSRGEGQKGTQTATESALLKEGGDTRQEMNVRQWETYLADMARKCFSHIDQFASTEDFAESLGQEKAMQIQFGNPFDLPGGADFEFVGADRVANRLIKQRNAKELAPMLMQNPNVLPGQLAHWLLKLHDVDTSEIEDMVIPDQVMYQLQQIQAQEEALREDQQSERDAKRQVQVKQTQAKFKENNTKETAQRSGRIISGNG